MSWISLILFPALLYCHLLNVELRHNVDGVPRQLCTLPTTPRFTCPHFPSLAFVPFPSASSSYISFDMLCHALTHAKCLSLGLEPALARMADSAAKVKTTSMRFWWPLPSGSMGILGGSRTG